MADGESPVAVRVEVGDALVRPTDVLVLKYAQALYGVDNAAVARMGGRGAVPLPGVGEYTVVRHPVGIAARAVLFLGVPPLPRFGYSDIRQFADRAVSISAREGLASSELCLTLHGVGFGLDELEALKSEVAGILDAVGGGRAPDRLERVVFLETDPRRSDRMRGVLRDLGLDAAVPRSDRPRPSRQPPSARDRLASVGYDSAQRAHAFVAMPFDDVFGDHLHFGIAPAVRDMGLLCERMDEVSFTGDVVDMMKSRIAGAALVIADVSQGNPNVALEIGYAWGCGVPTIIVCHEDSQAYFDVRGQRHLRYRSIRQLQEKLAAELRAILHRTGERR